MFKKIFIDLCNSKQEAPSSVCMKLGLSNATFSCWTDDTVPRRATLQRIADYFNVSVDYLLGKAPKKETTAQENGSISNLDLSSQPFLPGGRLSVHSPISSSAYAPKTYAVPVYENVSAGFGAYANENIVGYKLLPFSTSDEAENTLFIRVRGNSMSPKIEDGDLIQVYKTASVDSGTVAVVMVEDVDGEEAFVKKVVYGHGWVELHSLNPEYKVMRYEKNEIDRIRILGKVVSLNREM